MIKVVSSVKYYAVIDLVSNYIINPSVYRNINILYTLSLKLVYARFYEIVTFFSIYYATFL